MKPSPSDWAIAARILPGGPWHGYAINILRQSGVDTDEEMACMLSEARIFVARGWRKWDPSRGLAEWTYARHYVRAAASKRKTSKGGIQSPHWCNQQKLSPKCKAAWAQISSVPLQSHARIGANDHSRMTVADVIPAPPRQTDEARVAAALQATISAVAERAPTPNMRRRLSILAEAVLINEGCDREIAERIGLARQRVNLMRNEGAAYLVANITPAERFTLSLARSPE